jgi:ABC-2 type transport system permease protein
MKVLLHIIKFRLLTFMKMQAAIKPGTLIFYLGASAVYLLFAVGIYFFTQSIIKYLLIDVKIGLYLVHRFIFVVLFLFFISVNIGNIVVSYSTFFKTGETGFLLTRPVSFGTIFIVKFLDNFFYSSSTLLLMVIAALAGYTAYFGLPWYFIPLAVLFLILPFMLIAGTLGVMILFVIMRFAEKSGIKKVLTVIALFYAGAIVTFYLLSSPVELVTRVFENFPNLDIYMGYLENPSVSLLPNHWVANALFWIAAGKTAAAGWYIYLLIITSAVFFLLGLWLGKKWFYRTWLSFLDIPNQFSAGRKAKWTFISFGESSSNNPGREVLLKRELLLFLREPAQWIHFSVMLFLIIVFISSISGIDIIVLNAYNLYLKTLIYLIIFLFNVFLVASLSLRFVFPLVSLEGETVWKIRSAPVSFGKVVLTRLFIYFSVILLIGQVLNLVSNYQFPAAILVVSQLNAALVTVTLVSLNFGMGAKFANYREKNPVRIASSQGASLTFLFTIIYLVLLIIILFTPLNNFFYLLDRGRIASAEPLLATTIILAMTALLASYLGISRGMKALYRD